MLRRDVGGFGDVVFEIVEFDRGGLAARFFEGRLGVSENDFPRAFLVGEFATGGMVDDVSPQGSLVLAENKRKKAKAVFGAVRWKRLAEKIGASRENVVQAEDLIARGSCGDATRPTDH